MANLGSHPDNYPEGSIVRLNKNRSIGPHKPETIFSVLYISNKKDETIETTYDLTNKSTSQSSIIWIGLEDINNIKFNIKLSKFLADTYFLKGSKKSKTGENVTNIFANKQLTPANLGIVGSVLRDSDIVSKLKENRNYDTETIEFLLYLMNSIGIGESFDITIPNKYTTELQTINKDFGEILSSLWILRNESNIESISFPDKSNLPLIDFIGNSGTTTHSYSVKSLGGSNTTIGNIITNTEKQSTILTNLNTLCNLPMRDGMIFGHLILDTEGINILSRIIGINKNRINNSIINNWLNDKQPQQIKTELKDFYDFINSHPAEKMFEAREKNRLVIGPMGHSLVRILNNDSNYVDELNQMAKNRKVIQINVKISKKILSFTKSNFRDLNFVFDWAGYSGGNKLGFRGNKEKSS